MRFAVIKVRRREHRFVRIQEFRTLCPAWIQFGHEIGRPVVALPGRVWVVVAVAAGRQLAHVNHERAIPGTLWWTSPDNFFVNQFVSGKLVVSHVLVQSIL